MTDELSKKEREIVDGAVWNQFCDTLKMAGNVVMGPNTPSDPMNRMEGFRYLSRITRAALQTFVEHNDPLAPVLQRVVHETAKMGADHPDTLISRLALANQLAEDGALAEACQLSDGTTQSLAGVLGDDHWRVGVAYSLQGTCLLANGRLEESERALLHSYELLEAETGPRLSFKRQALRRLVQLYEQSGRNSDAQRYRGLLESIG